MHGEGARSGEQLLGRPPARHLRFGFSRGFFLGVVVKIPPRGSERLVNAGLRGMSDGHRRRQRHSHYNRPRSLLLLLGFERNDEKRNCVRRGSRQVLFACRSRVWTVSRSMVSNCARVSKELTKI